MRVGGNVGGLAARMAAQRLLGSTGLLGSAGDGGNSRNARELAQALGGLKGPIMKVAQLLSTIPEALPAEYATELQKLQADAPTMGPAFVNRRMRAELGPDWKTSFSSFSVTAAAAASLGQVHKATLVDGQSVACKLQYPDMQSAVEADVNQLGIVFSIHRRMNPPVETQDILTEIAARLREELDYKCEARHIALYNAMFDGDPLVITPKPVLSLTTERLLTMQWLEGRRVLDYKEAGLDARNQIARAMFQAWWYPFSHYGVIHGDPHLGNYTVQDDDGAVQGLNLLDYGCIRAFPPSFVNGVIELYHGLLHNERDRIVAAYESWGFRNLNENIISAMNIWAQFIYGPLLDNRVRRLAEDVAPGAYGRKEAFAVQKVLRENGPVRIPREFVFMDRAAIGLGAVFLHLGAELNWYEMFNALLDATNEDAVTERQTRAFHDAGVPLPVAGQ